MKPERLDALPVFPSPPAAGDYAAWRLDVRGLVASPLSLGYDEVRALPARELAADFRCEEGWEVRALRWAGVPLARIVDLAAPLDDARCVLVGSREFVASIPRSDVGAAEPLLAYLLDGAPVPWEHGGPLRLVMSEGLCYQSVKWVDRLELVADAAAETARGIALARIGRAAR